MKKYPRIRTQGYNQEPDANLYYFQILVISYKIKNTNFYEIRFFFNRLRSNLSRPPLNDIILINYNCNKYLYVIVSNYYCISMQN